MKCFVLLFTLISFTAVAQKSYTDSITNYQKEYVQTHEVVKGEDKKAIHFFPVQSKYKVVASVELKSNTPWFTMETSGNTKKIYRVFGVAHFTIDGKKLALNLYQSQSLMLTAEYKDLLFIPFTDLTTGQESYLGGRYIDLQTSDIKKGRLEIDFNKAYNPYCAYVNGKYNCPIPPKENNLPVAISAGEKAFTLSH